MPTTTQVPDGGAGTPVPAPPQAGTTLPLATVLQVCATEQLGHTTKPTGGPGSGDGYYELHPYNDATGPTTDVSYDTLMARYMRAAAVAYGASAGNPTKVCYRRADGGCNPVPADYGYGYDRGLWQLNSRKHPDVTDMAAFSPASSTRIAYYLTAGFTDWSAYAGNPGLLGLGNGPDGKPTLLQQAYDIEQLRSGRVIDKGVFGFPGEAALLDGAQAVITGAGLGTMLEIAQAALKVLIGAAQWVANPSNWLRLLEVVAGIGLVALGGTMVSRDLSPLAAAGHIAKAVS